jgi:PPOX class probable F420-dependent enzyme
VVSVNLASDEARARFAAARVARLATAGRDGQPHIVPVTFAVGDARTVVIAVDHKPKTTIQLKRLSNIARNPRVSLLVDVYDDDWSRLWWSRADGTAQVVDAGPDHTRAVGWLSDRYRQYTEIPPTGPVIVVSVSRWSGWSYAA